MAFRGGLDGDGYKMAYLEGYPNVARDLWKVRLSGHDVYPDLPPLMVRPEGAEGDSRPTNVAPIVAAMYSEDQFGKDIAGRNDTLDTYVHDIIADAEGRGQPEAVFRLEGMTFGDWAELMKQHRHHAFARIGDDVEAAWKSPAWDHFSDRPSAGPEADCGDEGDEVQAAMRP